MSIYPLLLRKMLMPSYEMIKGKNLLHYIAQYEKHLSWTPEALKKHQWHVLTQLINHAFHTTKYYPQAWAEIGITDPRDVATMSDFQNLPLTSKDKINEFYIDFKSDKFSSNIKKSTGGSTGQPFHFELNIDSNTRREAIMWRGYGWLGAGLGQKTLYLWGADVGEKSLLKTVKDDLYHRFYNRKMLNSFKMNKGNMHEYIDDINQYKPTALVSYVNPLFELSKYILANNINIYQPKTILTGAEPLHAHQREVIEKAFKCNVYDTFGCREFMLMSAECQQEKQLHINSDHLLIETLNEQQESITSLSGDLVITDLFNYGMPLIRYVNGDRATLLDASCPCGNPLPLMKSVDGRKLDIIKTPTGKTIPGELFPHLFKEFSSIHRFQVKQTQLNTLDIFIIPSEGFTTQVEENIINEINKYAESELKICIKLVNHIPLTVSGKHRVTICEV